MGADIEGAGTSTLVVHGVEPGSLHAADHEVVADRIQAATYLAATAITGGEVVLRGARHDHMETLLRRFTEMGVDRHRPRRQPGGVVAAAGRGPAASIDVATLPYPGIATDYKPLITTMLSVADGVGIVTENLYPGRFRYVEELQRLGADIRTDGHHAVVRGVPRLSAAHRCGPPTSAPARRSWSPGWPPTGRRTSAACTTSTAATTTSSAGSARSAPTSSGCPPERRPVPRGAGRPAPDGPTGAVRASSC